MNDIDPVVERIREKLRLRSNTGIKKYGRTMDREDLDTVAWLRYAQDESLDLAIYLERLDAIHPDAFTDNLGDLGHKDARAGIRGIIIAELGELAALNKSDIESVKAFVAARSDHFREAYGRGERDYPRTVSFIGTTNDPTFLKDPSGNRRWWPVTVTDTLDISRLEAALPQLLGEAAQRVLSGEPWYVKDALA